jgi:hypothetical protein
MDLDLFCPVCRRERVTRSGTCATADLCRLEVVGGSVRFYHDYYGCDTGCCGHRITVADATGRVRASDFEFAHDHADWKQQVAQLAAQYGLTIGECCPDAERMYGDCGSCGW